VRSLNPDEAELWAKVAATIRPLSRERLNPPRNGEGNQPQGGGGVPPRRPVPQSRPAATPVQARPVAIGDRTLDGSWDKRLRGGTVEPDRTLDLHGMTLDTAWQAIDRALERSIGAGDRVLLLITGHHRPGAPPVERGKIRAAVHDWLAASRHAPRIAAVRGAHRRHGGGGSLYIVLRRR
jgi:DNA-nicking Smr family endonuclease